MGSCKGKRKACAGAMRDRVTLQRRTLTEPIFGAADFGEDFDGKPRWAEIKTRTGRTYLSLAGTEQPITHEVKIRFDAAVDAETWILLDDGRRLDVLAVEDIDERHEFMLLTCTDRGSAEAAKA